MVAARSCLAALQLREPLVYSVLLLGLCFCLGATTSTNRAAGLSCQEGCRRGFKPVCGVDGKTYSTACIATCQGVDIDRQGHCPGEPILHPANKYVLYRHDDEDGSPQQGPGRGPAAASSSSHLLSQRHLDAFRHEGFRYSGQIAFAATMGPRPSANRDSGAAAGAGPQSAHGAQPKSLSHTQAPRVVRVTREGHMYTAELNDHVDTVLDRLIEQHSNASSHASAHGAGTAAHVHAMLLTLRQWRAYRPRDGRGGGGGGSKWAPRQTVLTTSRGRGREEGSGDHPLEPVLDAVGMAGRFVVGGTGEDGGEKQGDEEDDVALTGQVAGPGAVQEQQLEEQEQEEKQEQGVHQQEQQEQEQQGASGGKWLWGFGFGGAGAKAGGSRTEDPRRQQQQKEEGKEAKADGGVGRRDRPGSLHMPVRRSLGIFDTDDRVDCPRTPSYPFTAIGQINIRDPAGNYVCSGTLVGPDVVLTAAHCVFSRSAQTFYERLDFSPARYRTLDGQVVNPYGVIPWSYVTVYQGYSVPSSPDPNTQDIAVINLSQRIGTQAGWMGVFEPCSPFAPSRYVALTAGYPADQPAGSCKTTQCVVLQDPCTDGYLYHKCDTASGQSGSPMYMMAMTSARKMGPYVRAVHNIEWVQQTANGQMVSYINSAVSITPDHYRSILAWIGPSFTSNSTTPMGPALPPANFATSSTNSTANSTTTGRR